MVLNTDKISGSNINHYFVDLRISLTIAYFRGDLWGKFITGTTGKILRFRNLKCYKAIERFIYGEVENLIIFFSGRCSSANIGYILCGFVGRKMG